MDKPLLSALLTVAMLCHASLVAADVNYKIVTTSERGTYIKIGRNFIHEIKNAKLNAGNAGSGTALTSATL